MTEIKFSDLKEQIQESLREKLKDSPIPHENGFSMVDGFMFSDVRSEISNDPKFGGPNIPMVGLVGNTSGRIYTFALKIILPDLEFPK